MNVKKAVSLLLALALLFVLSACGADTVKRAEDTEGASSGTFAWTREGYFTDEDGNLVSVSWMSDIDEPGWYVGCMIGDLLAGCTIPVKGETLHGNLNGWDEEADPLIVTVSEEGEDGLLFVIDGGESYHLTRYDLPEASIFVSVSTEGWGNIDYAEGEEAPDVDPDYGYQSAQINLAEPQTHTFAAWPDSGWVFVKWTKNGEDFSTEPVITVLLDESADFVAVFEEDAGETGETEDEDYQNPVMNFIGPYVCDRARAQVECEGKTDARIVIEWADSAEGLTRWILIGTLDTDTLTVQYTDGIKCLVTYDKDGNETSEAVEYADGTGTVTFAENGTFTWHEDGAEREEDLVFQWSFTPEEE